MVLAITITNLKLTSEANTCCIHAARFLYCLSASVRQLLMVLSMRLEVSLFLNAVIVYCLLVGVKT
jgi:hypothetical protein